MSSSSAVQNRQPSRASWAMFAPYVTPPIAAAAAIIPTFCGFVVKSAQQVGEQIPRMSVKEALKGGVRAAPTLGVIIGTQMVAQRAIEKALNNHSKREQPASFVTMLASAMVVGTISAPPLAVFNGQTRGHNAMKSLKELSMKKTGAIVTRETSFLFAIRISGPLGTAMRSAYGDNKAVEYSSAFVSGVIGSVIGHPADTALTLWQEGLKVVSFRRLMRGAPIKAVTVGGFSLCYKLAQEILNKPWDS